MKKNILFWNVDTQVDFVEPYGKLYVKGAELLKPIWADILKFAEENNIRVVSTADFHYPGSAELSHHPDYISTFPEHCMANTKGSDYIKETTPSDSFVVDWDKQFTPLKQIVDYRNIVIRKDAFDIFAGNPYTETILKMIDPEIVVVFGVTTNVCVNDAVVGLAKRVNRVVVIEDAIKELPNIPLPFENWEQLGVEMIKYANLKSLV